MKRHFLRPQLRTVAMPRSLGDGVYETWDGLYQVRRGTLDGWKPDPHSWHVFKTDGSGGWDYLNTAWSKREAYDLIDRARLEE